MRIERKDIPKIVLLDLLRGICGFLFIMLFSALLVLAVPCDGHAASEGVSYSPVVHLECLPRDTYRELEDHLPDWGFIGLEIVAHYDEDRHLWSGQDGFDGGSFGPWHLQQADPFDLGVTSRFESPWTDDPEWRDWMIAIGYSDHSAELQATAWLDIVEPVVSDASAERPGLSEGELAGIAAMSNSSPARTRTWGRATGWDVHQMLELYLDFHNHSLTKQRRVERIRSRL